MNNEVDLLRKVEELTAKLNQVFGEKGRHFFVRYPLTFAILIVFGVVMVTEGIKLWLLEIPFFKDKPYMMLLGGLLVLIITGSLYKKLRKIKE